MKKLGYLILGALIGAVIGWLGCNLIWCVDDFLSCGKSNIGDDHVMASTIVCAGIAGLIGFTIGAFADSEESDQKKQYEANLATQRWQNWTNELTALYNQAFNKCFEINWEFDPSGYYKQIRNKKNEMDNSDNRYQSTYDSLYSENVIRLKNNIVLLLKGDASQEIEPNLLSLIFTSNLLLCLKEVKPSETLDKALNVIGTALNIVMRLPLMYLEQKEYGDFVLPLDDPKEFAQTTEWISSSGLPKLQSVIDSFSNSSNIIEVIADGKLLNFLKASCLTMWYYAKQKPFDVDKFNKAVEHFNRYTVKNDIVKVEVLLARIYAKNQLGGVSLVKQEIDSIIKWVENVREFSYEDCALLASGLAWMELYEIELMVLRKLVEIDVQLPADIQERLSFLESGGTTNIKIYSIDKSDDYIFDNSSLDWDAKDYSVFFRKLSMKKIEINYSLAYSKWTKTLPLASGQKVSFESIVNEFKLLVSDFDGEVVTYATVAKAINLVNLEYRDAVIFKFTHERNRCIEMLFSCEKFGRNLNITILTMFAPDNTLSAESLEKYCSAIKNNLYIDSFRESILQAVDVVVKEKQSVYGNEVDEPKKKTIIE